MELLIGRGEFINFPIYISLHKKGSNTIIPHYLSIYLNTHPASLYTHIRFPNSFPEIDKYGRSKVIYISWNPPCFLVILFRVALRVSYKETV